MLISRVWLGEMLAGTLELAQFSDADLMAALTGMGLEVEGARRCGHGLDDVVVGEIVGVDAHPSADRLRVVVLHDGREHLTVVCGAPNVPAPGGKVLFARPGARLPGDFDIAAREVRGVMSHGMICSEAELDIGPDSSGIVVLDGAAVPGTPLTALVPGALDTIIELSVTPNRPDALGHVGVARDLAVKLGTMWRPTIPALPQVETRPTLVTLHAADRCGRYFGIALDGATIAPSPLWARVRLHRLGLRPLSNAVDVTNYVLLQWGQPLHAFDRAQLRGGRVVVRQAQAGEPLRTLDGRELVLTDEDLVIADAERPMALAGVMGGEHSGVAADTSTLLLEAAWFEPRGIRRSARRHGLSTDSSHRFERGVDHGEGLQGACAEAVALLQRWCGAEAVAMCVVHGARPRPAAITYRPARAAALLGMDVPAADVRRIFAGLGVTVTAGEHDASWACVAPTHRPDLEREVDLVDEVVRHWGLDRLPMIASPVSGAGEPAPPAVRVRGRIAATVVDALREAGLHEVVSLVFARPEALAAVGEDPDDPALVRLSNPMRAEAGVLRTHLLPGLLDALALNVARHHRPVALFECGRVYRHAAHAVDDGPTAAVDAELPDEPTRAAVLCGGAVFADAAERARVEPQRVGAALLHALARLGAAATVRSASAPVAWLHPGAQAELVLPSGTLVGRFGRVHPRLLAAWDLPRTTELAYGELWHECLPAPRVPQFVAVPRFPGSSRDLSLDVAIALPIARIVEALGAAVAAATAAGDDAPRLWPGDRGLGAIEVVEDYRGEGIAAGRRALLLRMHYRCQHRSVTDAEVHPLHEAAVEAACAQLRHIDAHLRRR